MRDTYSQAQASKSTVTNPSNIDRNKKFEALYGQRLEATLIGSDEIDLSHLNKDLMSVQNDLANLLKMSQKVSEKEKSKVFQQLSVKPQHSSLERKIGSLTLSKLEEE